LTKPIFIPNLHHAALFVEKLEGGFNFYPEFSVHRLFSRAVETSIFFSALGSPGKSFSPFSVVEARHSRAYR
jgi:hypothetical protein